MDVRVCVWVCLFDDVWAFEEGGGSGVGEDLCMYVCMCREDCADD